MCHWQFSSLSSFQQLNTIRRRFVKFTNAHISRMYFLGLLTDSAKRCNIRLGFSILPPSPPVLPSKRLIAAVNDFCSVTIQVVLRENECSIYQRAQQEGWNSDAQVRSSMCLHALFSTCLLKVFFSFLSFFYVQKLKFKKLIKAVRRYELRRRSLGNRPASVGK